MKISILYSNAEPYLNLVESLSEAISSRGVDVEQSMIETTVLPLSDVPLAVMVMSNLEEAWRLAAAAVTAGSILCNGDIRACYLERRIWKISLTRSHPELTPTWISSGSPAQLMRDWPDDWFPAFLKPADASSGQVTKVVSKGGLADLLVRPVFSTASMLLERCVGVSDVTVKVYSVGDQHYAVRCAQDKVIGSVVVNRELLELAQAVQESAGLRILSFDCKTDSDGRYQVVDVNRFPVFQGSRAMDGVIADYVVASLELVDGRRSYF